MDNATSEPRHCEVCGSRLYRHNTTGICQKTAACRRAQGERWRRANGMAPKVRKTCKHPDGCPEESRRDGYCSMHHQRLQRTGELGPVGSLRNVATVEAGDTFARWTALEVYDRKVSKRILCRCECGTEKRVDVYSLTGGSSQSCGCLQHDKARQPRSLGTYLTAGSVSGRLTALEDAVYADDRICCQCECGTETVKRAETIKSLRTRSCGCLARDVSTVHGLSGHPLYSIWRGMIHRCESPSDHAYADYGGRGIAVCERWRGLPDGLLNFAADMGERPPRMQVDRYPDNDGNYEPGNTRWATPEQQCRNKRTVASLTARLEAALEMLAGANKWRSG